MASKVPFHRGGKLFLEVSRETPPQLPLAKLGAIHAPALLQGFYSGRGSALMRKWGVMAVGEATVSAPSQAPVPIPP